MQMVICLHMNNFNDFQMGFLINLVHLYVLYMKSKEKNDNSKSEIAFAQFFYSLFWKLAIGLCNRLFYQKIFYFSKRFSIFPKDFLFKIISIKKYEVKRRKSVNQISRVTVIKLSKNHFPWIEKNVSNDLYKWEQL